MKLKCNPGKCNSQNFGGVILKFFYEVGRQPLLYYMVSVNNQFKCLNGFKTLCKLFGPGHCIPLALLYVKAGEGVSGYFNYELVIVLIKEWSQPCFSICVWGNSSTGRTWELVRKTEHSGPTADGLNQNLHLTTENLLSHFLKHYKAIPTNKNVRENEKEKKKKEVVQDNIILAIS